MICRVCHEDTNEKDNQLISPCKCKGSIKYIHEQCLSQWLKHVQKVTCELCQCKYESFLIDLLDENIKIFSLLPYLIGVYSLFAVHFIKENKDIVENSLLAHYLFFTIVLLFISFQISDSYGMSGYSYFSLSNYGINILSELTQKNLNILGMLSIYSMFFTSFCMFSEILKKYF